MQEDPPCEPISGFPFVEIPAARSNPSDVVIVHLHGIGERGDDLRLVTRFGLPAAVREGRALVNCPVLCPQLEADAQWDADRVASFVRSAGRRFAGVVLIGYSLGGSGVCQAVARFGELARLHVAIAGQGPERAGADQAGVRFLAIQGELDPWPCTDGLVSSINEQGGRARSVVLAGAGHFVSETALAHPVSVAMLQEAGVELVFRGEAR